MLYAIVVVLILIADQGLKYWTISHFSEAVAVGESFLYYNSEGEAVKEFIPGFLQLTRVHNYGAAFNLFDGWRWVLVALTIVFAAVVIFALSREMIHGRVGQWLAVVVLGGALGNCIDRVINGYVVDTLEFAFKIFGSDFPVFNIADMFLVVGGILFCIYVIVYKDPDAAPKGKRVAEPVKNTRRGPAGEPVSALEPERTAQESRPRIRRVVENPDSQPRDTVQRTRVPAPPSGAPQRAARPEQTEPKPARPPSRAAQPQQRAEQPPAPARSARTGSSPASKESLEQARREEPRKTAPKPPVDDSFDLDDILNEFRDK